MRHWTYSEAAEAVDLEQGDFLVPSLALKEILREVHPHFRDDKYLGFAVTTQTCDLTRRNGTPPNARYISISSVRSLKQVLPLLLSQVTGPIAPGVFGNSSKRLAQGFLKRVFDQNEQAMGLFYFHPDEALGIAESAIAFLRVTVSLRVEHYDALRNARTARLTPEFQAKFGWLVGNLYSRVASRDWSDEPGGKKQLEDLIRSNLTEQIVGFGPLWVDDDAARRATAAGIALEALPRGDLLQALEANRPQPKISQVVDVVVAEATKVLPAEEAALKTLKNRLLNSGVLGSLVR